MCSRNVARELESMATLFDDGLYEHAMRTVADLKPCPFAGVVTADQVKLALGELLDIWPDSIAPKCASHGVT